MLIDELQYRIFGEYVPAKPRTRKTLTRTTTLGLSSQASVADPQPADRRAPASPPARSPFEIIPSLEQSMIDDDQQQRNRNKNAANVEHKPAPADAMMTKDQYHALYKITDMEDADVINRTLGCEMKDEKGNVRYKCEMKHDMRN